MALVPIFGDSCPDCPVCPDGPGWDVSSDTDLTGLDAATLTSGATTNVTRGGQTVAAVWAQEASNGGTITAGSAGISCDGASGTGSVNALLDVATLASLTLPADIQNGVVVDLYLTGLADWTGTGTAWRAGLSTSLTRFSVGDSNSVQGRLNGAGQDRRIATNESFTTWVTGEAVPASAWVVSFRIDAGSVIWAWYGTTAPSDADVDALTGAVLLSSTIAADISTPAADARYGSALYAGIMAQLQARFTLTRVRVRTRRVA